MGLALLWKPRGIGSQDCLARFKRETLGLRTERGRSSIGHTGTLDPFAEGILLVGWLEGTKLLAPLQGLDKTYIATIAFGKTTETLDPDSQIIVPDKIKGEHCLRLDQSFSDKAQSYLDTKLGTFDQIPPKFSALHVDGKRAYDLARQGKEVTLKARKVSLLEAKHLDFDEGTQTWRVEVRVSSGTYIRCLARDWAKELTGFEGHLTGLIRTGVGPFQWSAPSPIIPQPHPAANPLLWKALKITDLSPLFESLKLADQDAQMLRQVGRLRSPQPLSGITASGKPIFAVDSQGMAVAWLEPGGQKIGRVFLHDPFAYGLPNASQD